jgi:hypothetical protein
MESVTDREKFTIITGTFGTRANGRTINTMDTANITMSRVVLATLVHGRITRDTGTEYLISVVVSRNAKGNGQEAKR